MKAKLYLILAVVACMMYNCSQEEVLEQPQRVTNTLTASIDGSSRSTVTDAGIFSWTAGDQISVWNGSNFVIYSNTSGNNFSTTVTNPGTPQTYAVYPAGTHNYEYPNLTVNLPAEYDYSEQEEYVPNTNAPMLASFKEGEDIVFKHLGGLMRFIVNDVPAGANEFVFTSSDKNITGAFAVDVANNTISATDATTANFVSIKFEQLGEQKDKMIFYVPLPVGTYTGYTVAIKGVSVGGSWTLADNNSSQSSINKVVRRSLLLMPEFTCDELNNKLVKATAANVTPSTSGVSADVTGGTVNIANPSGTAAKATINFDPADDAILNIVDASSADIPQTSNATVGVVVEGGANVPLLNIQAPTTTVVLSASSTATYQTVTALTATNTLYVNPNIVIERLILKGGNVLLEPGAEVKSTVVYDAATLKTALTNIGGNVILGDDITISEKLEIEKDVTIDGGNHTLTYTGYGSSARAIDVQHTDVDLTIKNLTVDCTASYCQRGINYNTGSELNLENVTVKGTNVTYALNLPGNSDNAQVEIKNCKLTGNIALNVWGENATINVTDSELTSVDTKSEENYQAVCLNNDGTTMANGTNIEITGGKIVAKDENDNLSTAYVNHTETGTITISSTTEVVGIQSTFVAIVTYEGTDNYYSCPTLQVAIEKAYVSGAKIMLLSDITLAENLSVGGNVTIDLNGKTLTLGEYDFSITDGKTLTVNGPGKLIGNTTTDIADGNHVTFPQTSN